MLNIEEIFSNDSWLKLQESLVKVTNLAITIVNYKGEKITEHYGCHEFCDKVRKDPRLSKFCERCDARAGFEAMRMNQPYIYRCYFSIVDIAIPVVLNNKYIGAIMAGQIRVPEEEGKKLEKIMTPANEELLIKAKEELSESFDKLPVIPLEQIEMTANMLYYMCNYLSSEQQKNMNKYRELLNKAYPDADGEQSESEIIISKNNKKKETLAKIHKYTRGQYSYYNDIIKKVFDYIFSDEDLYPSLQEVSSYCHVSTGYMSRLFSKEVGESYSEFMSRLKIDRAKNILETSDMSIYELSYYLGYKDTGYFIKVFKREMGVTPAVYRNFVNKKELDKIVNEN